MGNIMAAVGNQIVLGTEGCSRMCVPKPSAVVVGSKFWADKTGLESCGLQSGQFKRSVSAMVKQKTVQQEVFGRVSTWKISKISLVRLGNGF